MLRLLQTISKKQGVKAGDQQQHRRGVSYKSNWPEWTAIVCKDEFAVVPGISSSTGAQVRKSKQPDWPARTDLQLHLSMEQQGCWAIGSEANACPFFPEKQWSMT